jgi:AcrR family transcriptional regulator
MQQGRPELTVSEERRVAILDSLADHVLEHGLSASSLRALAAAAGTSDRMLLYYFRDKPELIAATLARIAERLVAILDGQRTTAPRPMEELRAELVQSLFSDQFWPYMRLWIEIAALSAKGDPFYRQVGGEIGRGFLAWGASQLAAPDPESRARDAARLLVTIEGMLLLKSIGLDDVVDEAG